MRLVFIYFIINKQNGTIFMEFSPTSGDFLLLRVIAFETTNYRESKKWFCSSPKWNALSTKWNERNELPKSCDFLPFAHSHLLLFSIEYRFCHTTVCEIGPLRSCGFYSFFLMRNKAFCWKKFTPFMYFPSHWHSQSLFFAFFLSSSFTRGLLNNFSWETILNEQSIRSSKGARGRASVSFIDKNSNAIY